MSCKDNNYYKEIFQKYLEGYLLQYSDTPEPLKSAINYALLGGGKRIRPSLVLATADMLGGDVSDALPVALALEMIHTYSLVHDDLPCMDDDDMRRGRPTTHVVYGEDIAVITGDALLTDAFSLIADSHLDADIVKKVTSVLANRAGSRGMVGGQCADLAKSKIADEETILYTYKHKTSDLIIASLVAGGIVARASSEVLDNLSQFGYYYGLAFQITDDLLEVNSTPELTGKSIGGGTEEEKTTYLSIFGVEKSTKKAREYVDKCMEIASAIPNSQFLVSLVEKVVGRMI
ncbi:MAG: polyprenyl synthetase family protein [Clostridia bacterium]|nr:polyprenyl synthetase family protein [Clostridia bacterium]